MSRRVRKGWENKNLHRDTAPEAGEALLEKLSVSEIFSKRFTRFAQDDKVTKESEVSRRSEII
jgi:hypothetical protein